jgi:hypothetical protein
MLLEFKRLGKWSAIFLALYVGSNSGFELETCSSVF